MSRTQPPLEHSVQLTQRRIYTVPSRHGLLFMAILALMLLGSMNYNNSMGFVLTFLLGSMAAVSLLHTYRNMARLKFNAGHTEAVFAGESLHYQLWVDNREQPARYALYFQAEGTDTAHPPAPVVADIPAGQQSCISIAVPTSQRGPHNLGKVLLETHFPLGLFRAWSYLYLDCPAWVYPCPEGSDHLPAGEIDEEGHHQYRGETGEDFIGYRDYRLGDSPRHVDWKAVAKQKGMLVKQFGGEAGQTSLWLDWQQVAHLEQETALSQLCHWLLLADAQNLTYGLRLGELVLEPAHSNEHKTQCLEALAGFNQTPSVSIQPKPA